MSLELASLNLCHGRPENPHNNRKSCERSSSNLTQTLKLTSWGIASVSASKPYVAMELSNGCPTVNLGSHLTIERVSAVTIDLTSLSNASAHATDPFDRRAGCVAHKSGSVRGAPGQPGVSTRRGASTAKRSGASTRGRHHQPIPLLRPRARPLPQRRPDWALGRGGAVRVCA
jgi:hypothetical protein